MGFMISYVICPECGYTTAEEKLRNTLEEKGSIKRINKKEK